jgi:hypothetical protein
MVIPSQALAVAREGVETVRQASHVDEETVQTANSKEATKVVVVRITDWSLVQIQPGPPNIINLTLVN